MTASPSSAAIAEREPEPIPPQTGSARRLLVLDHGRPGHRVQPYQQGAVIQVRPERSQCACRSLGMSPVQEQPVDRRAGAADVGAEGAVALELVSQR